MTHLVIGLGEVGKAVRAVLGDAHGLDLDGGYEGPPVDAIHVCIPYTEGFQEAVKGHQTRFLKPDGLTIVHSTVPLGTCDALGAVHSPVRGVHPNLEAGVRTFVKAFGGPRAEEAAAIFADRGVNTTCSPNAKDTEAAKLWCTTAYFASIMVEKEMHRFCEENGLDFEFVYSQWTRDYNAGYDVLGMGNVARPVLAHKPGGIGGHCLVPNAALLGHWLGDLLLRKNKEYQETGL